MLKAVALGLAIFAVASFGGTLAAQTTAAPAQAEAQQPVVKLADVASPDAIMDAAYDSISGPATQERDWNRLRSLFLPGAHLISTAPDASGKYTTTVMSVDEFVAAAEPYFKQNDFFEREIWSHSDRYANIIQRFSTYASSRAKGGEPFARGVNSFQLLYKDGRWWVVTIFWQEEDHDYPIPAKLLPGKK
jgi:hypothetical protein